MALFYLVKTRRGISVSRIGKAPIIVPDKVQVEISDRRIKVKGPKGALEREIPLNIKVEKEGNIIKVLRSNDSKKVKALHGLTRALIVNMVTGVCDGFKKILVIEGLGYKAETKGNKLVLHLGYSHPIEYEAKEGIKFYVEGNKIIVEGIDKELVGQSAAIVRQFHPPEPYKGKGIRYIDERIWRKVGKGKK